MRPTDARPLASLSLDLDNTFDSDLSDEPDHIGRMVETQTARTLDRLVGEANPLAPVEDSMSTLVSR